MKLRPVIDPGPDYLTTGNPEDVTVQGYGATLETVAKLRRDPIEVLIARRSLPQSARTAAKEIRQAFAHITQPVALRISELTFMPGRPKKSGRGPELLYESERMAAMTRRYLEWGNALLVKGLPAWPVHDVVIEEIPPRTIDKIRRKGHGTTLKLLKAGLGLYGELRGWRRFAA